MTKIMQREIKTNVVSAVTIDLVDGQVVTTPVEDHMFIGEIKADKAEKIISKEIGQAVKVIKVTEETHMYKMPVSTFVANATEVDGVLVGQLSIDETTEEG